MSDINMRILLSAIGGASVVSSVQSIASSLGNGSGGLGGALLGIGAAAATVAVGIGVTAVKAAGDFQSGMTTLVTGAGEAQKNIGLVSNGILNLADSTGATTAQLTSAMYQTESAGYHGAAGLSVLAAAARGARVGNADLGTVADATTTIMTDFGIKSGNASVAVNTLIATVANGKTTMDQLAASLSQIMPTASAAGVSLTDTSAAMATMTGEGVPAANAATYLRQTILGLEAPSKQTVTALANVGLTSSQVSDEMKKSLPGALKMITDAVGKQFPAGSAEYVNAIKNISGGAKTMQGMLDLTGSHMATFNANVANISSAVKNGGNSITGWTLVQQDFNFKMAQGKEIIETLGIRLGQVLLPAVTNVLNAVLPLASNFSVLLTSSSPLIPVFTNIGSMLGIMRTNWQGLAPVLAPVSLAFQKFGALVSGLLPGALSQFLRVMNDVNMVVVIVAGAVSGWITPALLILGQTFKGVQAGLEPVLNAIEGRLLPAFQNLVTAIAPIVTHLLQWIANSGVITPLLTGLGFAIGIVVTIVSGLINVLASVITFFTQTELGVDLLKGTFILLGIILGTIAAVVLPGIIAGFVATAVSAIATGISIAIAFLPITLIVLGIIAVIALVILAVQHWGQIVDFLKQAWSSVAAFFTGIWHNIQQAFGNAGNWFHDRFTQASNSVKAGFGNVGNWFQQQGNNIKQTAQNIGKGVVDAFNWMYAHNYYFKAMVDAITKLATQLGNWLVGAWNSIKSTAISVWSSTTAFIIGLWQALSFTATSVWSAITSTITSVVSAVTGWLQSTWTTATSWLGSQWHSLSGLASSAWAAVTGVFNGAWGSISGALAGLWAGISGWFSNLAGQMFSFGQNLINMLASGITNAAGAVTSAASGIANNIASILGFHSPPPSGPAADSDQWMGSFVNMLASGLINAQPILQSALNVTAKSLASVVDPSTVADQLNFTKAPTSISSGTKKPVETAAQKKKEEEEKKAEAKKKEEEKKAAAAEKAHEKKVVHADIKEIKAELHIHTSNAKLDKAQIDEIIEQAMRQFGLKLGDEIRAQFGNV